MNIFLFAIICSFIISVHGLVSLNTQKGLSISRGVTKSNYERFISRLNLGFDDIIDNDADLLEQLRVQLQNVNSISQVSKSSGNFNTREISNRIKAFFISKNKGVDETNNFKGFLSECRNSLDILHGISLLDGLSHMDAQVNNLIDIKIVEEAMMKSSNIVINSSMIVKVFNALHSLQFNEKTNRRILNLLFSAIKNGKISLGPSDCCSCIYHLQSIRISINAIELNNFLSYFTSNLNLKQVSLTPKSICNAIYGLRKFKATQEVRLLLSALKKKIIESEMYCHSVNICIALNGLQNMEDYYFEVRELLKALIDKSVPAEEQGAQICKDREISMALFGLQKMGLHPNIYSYSVSFTTPSLNNDKISPELKSAVVYITSLLNHYTGPYESKRLGFAMMGCVGLPGDLPETQDLILALSTKAENAVGPISGQELSMCIHGLLNLRPEHTSTRRLISALVPLINQCEAIKSLDLSSAIFGLQSMRIGKGNDSKSPQQSLDPSLKDFQLFINAFSDLIKRSHLKFDSLHDIAKTMFGLQSLSSNSNLILPLKAQIVEILSSTIEYEEKTPGKIAKFSGDFVDSRDISLMLYSLRSSSSSTDEITRKLFSKISKIISMVAKADYEASKRGDPVLSIRANDVAAALFGLQKSTSESREVLELIQAILPLVYQAEGSLNSKGLFMLLNGLQGLSSKELIVQKLIATIHPIVERSIKDFEGFNDFYYISGAINGFTRLNSKHAEVSPFVNTCSQLLTMKPKHTSSFGQKQSKPKKLTQERIGIALYGLQGLNHKLPSVSALFSEISPQFDHFPQLDGKTIGMSLHAFKFSTGSLSPEQEKILSCLADRVKGLSYRCKNPFPNKPELSKTYIKSVRVFLNEAQITLRSALVGMQTLDPNNELVRKILLSLAEEIFSWLPILHFIRSTHIESESENHSQIYLEKSTYILINDIFARPELSNDPVVNSMLEGVSTFVKKEAVETIGV